MFDEKKYEINVLSNNKISEFTFFGGGSEILNFDVTENDHLFILEIPFELFLNPFDVYLTEKDDMDLNQIDKIRKTEFGQNDTHVKLSFRTNSEGTISVLGATLEEHEKKLDQIKIIKSREVESQIVEEKKKGLALPIPGTKAASELASGAGKSENNEKIDTLSFADELKKGQTQNSDNIMTIIGIIVGLIIIGIISGVIFKLKKN